jgi:DNA replication and repair protein RecF
VPVRVTALTTLGFRNLADARLEVGPGLTVLHGPNGAGKTNVLEALFFALTGRSCRTRREREAITFGASLARAEAELEGSGEGESLAMLASVSTTEGRRRRVDGRDARSEDDLRRPAISVFMPDRLALVKGAPSPRRAHLDRLVGALWPARAAHASAYRRALAQRNALIARIRRGGDRSSLDAWDVELAERALPLIATRAAAVERLAGPFATAAESLGLGPDAAIAYRPRTGELDRDGLVAELSARRDSDLGRGFSGYGPHLDEVEMTRGGRSVRRYGSQGQQRVALLALLFAEREALREARRELPLLLLDDVMSELDHERRRRLVDLLGGEGQALLTATELDQVPAGDRVAAVAVADGVTSP